MDLKVSQSVSGGGVILKPSTRSRKWTFTVNNYQSSDLVSVVSLVSTSEAWIYGFEKGESGTPHIQGYVQFKNQKRFSTLKAALPKAHWEKARGTSDQNYRYCSKEGDFQTNMVPKMTRREIIDLVKQKLYTNVVWRPWQQEIIDISLTSDCPRTIYWFYEQSGNVGKSFVCKYLALADSTIICSGKSSDIFNQVNATIESGTYPKVVICDIPRVCLEYISYQAIECLKNGLLYSGKYEGGKCIFPSPVILCFANERPKVEKLSKDRWDISKIQDNKLYKVLF